MATADAGYIVRNDNDNDNEIGDSCIKKEKNINQIYLKLLATFYHYRNF